LAPGQLIILIAMFVLLWLLLIRPQRKRQLEQQELQASIEVGDEILTVGGLYGYVRELLEDNDLLVEIAPGTNVRIARRSVAGVVELDEDETEDGERAELNAAYDETSAVQDRGRPGE
jgi:preprotein translocase subunit YajC